MFEVCKIDWYRRDEGAIIPTKTEAAAGFDIYTTEKEVILEPHSQHLFATGLSAVVSEGYWLMVFDRGSTGSKGLHVHCGVIDNDYRGEIFICLNNDNNYPVKFTKTEEPGIHSHAEQITTGPEPHNGIQHSVAIIKEITVIDYLVYPTSKAIAQIIPVAQPLVECREISDTKWARVKDTERGEGKLGSSGK